VNRAVSSAGTTDNLRRLIAQKDLVMVSEWAVLRGQPSRFVYTNLVTETGRACVLETLVSPEGDDTLIIGSLDGLKSVPLGFEEPIQTRGIQLDISPSPSGAQRA